MISATNFLSAKQFTRDFASKKVEVFSNGSKSFPPHECDFESSKNVTDVDYAPPFARLKAVFPRETSHCLLTYPMENFTLKMTTEILRVKKRFTFNYHIKRVKLRRKMWKKGPPLIVV